MIMQIAQESNTTAQHMTIQTADSRRRVRLLTVLSGFVKPSGAVCALFRNDEGEQYRTSINALGDGGSCSCQEGKETQCVCYHMQTLFAIAHTLPTYDEIVAPQPRQQEPELVYAPAVGGCYSFRAPVVTLTQAMAEAQQAMGGYDSCGICGNRVKVGQRYCSHC